MRITNADQLREVQQTASTRLFHGKVRITVGTGTCGKGNNADNVFERIKELVHQQNIDADVVPVGCFGPCSWEPLVMVFAPGRPAVIYKEVATGDVPAILGDVQSGRVTPGLVLGKISRWDFINLPDVTEFGKGFPEIPEWNEVPFFKFQTKIVLRACGMINPKSIEEYIGAGGYSALAKVLTHMTPEKVIEEMLKSKLRGRGGAGFPVWQKWKIMQGVKADKKYVICNADEGDPGAFMNRNEIESDPHMLVEGMIIGAWTMGAREGVIYIRAEYPQAVERIKAAIEQAREWGFLGQNILGTAFDFDISVVEGAGAFVCGEETALMASVEGKAGRPRPRPPFPAQKGLYDMPTTINNVESWCNIAPIILKGADWFASHGTAKSAGTKVFSLVGKVKNTGLVELTLGTPLEVLIFNIGGGSCTDRKVKAVQLGGPSGGCVPVGHFNALIDYESLAALGAIIGSGGIVVMDEYNCMVDVARYFTEFTTSESCGKCTPCREGLNQALNILNNITTGTAAESDLVRLDKLCHVIKDSALCGLGQTAPNPVLTTMKYFRDEYLEHIREHRCAAGQCQALYIAPCENSCPLHANIPGFLELVREDRMEDAFQIFMENNPMPSTSGRVCQAHCNVICRRTELDGAVNQKEIHRYVADLIYHQRGDDKILAKFIASKMPDTGRKMAIVGAGPAGLTAAFYLIRLGHEVTIYDSLPKPGGMLRYAIPEYRLPKTVLDREIEFIEKLGVKFVNNTKIGVDIALADLERENDAVFLGIGVWKEIPLDIHGATLHGVVASFKILEDIAANKNPNLGRNVVVIGGGNSAIDSARSVFRLGKEVTLVYRRDREDMPAFEEEIVAAEKEGIKFMFMMAPKEIKGDKNVKEIVLEKMAYGDFDRTGRRRPMPTGDMVTIPADNVIIAIGERVESEFIKTFGVDVQKDGRVLANIFTLQTNRPKIYAGGDLVTGPSTVAEAMASGKRAAFAMDNALGGHNWDKLFAKFEYSKKPPAEPEGGDRKEPSELSLPARQSNFKEVILGLSDMQCHEEACRCLRCDIK